MFDLDYPDRHRGRYHAGSKDNELALFTCHERRKPIGHPRICLPVDHINIARKRIIPLGNISLVRPVKMGTGIVVPWCAYPHDFYTLQKIILYGILFVTDPVDTDQAKGVPVLFDKRNNICV